MIRPTLGAALLASALALAAPAGPVLADGAIVALMTDTDREVLDAFDTRRAAAIAEAEASPDAADRATLTQVLAGEVLPFNGDHDPSGEWRCRYLKLGGMLPLTVYGWFQCRVYDDGAGWIIHKTTGSQRTMGRLYQLTDERLLYLGAQYYHYEEPRAFNADPARNQMAVLTRLDDGRMRLEFPAPLAESNFDILEMERVPGPAGRAATANPPG